MNNIKTSLREELSSLPVQTDRRATSRGKQGLARTPLLEKTPPVWSFSPGLLLLALHLANTQHLLDKMKIPLFFYLLLHSHSTDCMFKSPFSLRKEQNALVN